MTVYRWTKAILFLAADPLPLVSSEIKPKPWVAPPMAHYTAQSRHHVYLNGHAANSPPMAGQSRFLPTEGGQAFTDEVIAAGGAPVIQTNGRLRYEVPDLGRAVGYDRNGNLTRGGIIVVEGPQPGLWSTFVADEVVTQYPW